MEIFYQSLYKFTGEANKRERRQIVLKDSKIESEEIYENLESAKARSQRPESVLQKIYRYIVCKSWFCFLLPIWWMTIFVIVWPNYSWLYIIDNLLLVPLYCYLIFTNPVTNNWFYIFRLQVCLWFRRSPKPEEKRTNPRCVFMNWKSAEKNFFWIKLLQKLQKELSIDDISDLQRTIKVIENPEKFKILYLIQDAVFTFRFTKVHLLIVIASFFFILSYDFGMNIAIKNNLGLVVFYTLIYSICQWLSIIPSWFYNGFFFLRFSLIFSNVYNASVRYKLFDILWYVIAYWIISSSNRTEYYEINPEHSYHMLDVICRLHREIKNESIYFTIVTDDLRCFEKIPEQFRKYFNFIIIPASNSELTENYVQIFDLSMISNITPPRPIPSSTNMELRKWVDASLRCINDNTTQFVGGGLKFLSLLIATNNGSLTEIEMLSVVKMQLKAFAENYTNEISFKNQGDVQKVKDFFGYLQMLEIIPKTSTEP